MFFYNKLNIFWTARLIVLLCLVYAITRYNIFGQVAWSHVPLFILNKSLSMASTVIFLLATFSKYAKEGGRLKHQTIIYKGFVSIAYLFVFLHVLISVILIGPIYYPKFFSSDGFYSFSSELALLSGVMGFYFFTILVLSKSPNIKKIIFVTTHPWVYKTSFICVVVMLFMIHCLLIGASSWASPNTWPGFIPPISLLSFIVLAVTLFRLIRNNG